MQRFRHGAAGSSPSDYGKNRLSKRSPLRLATDAKVRDHLLHIFGASDTGTAKATPPPNPLKPNTTSAPSSEGAPTTPDSTSTTADRQSGAHAPMAPTGENNGTLHKDHEDVHDHEHEQAKHAPPMLSADGRQPFTRVRHIIIDDWLKLIGGGGAIDPTCNNIGRLERTQET